MAPTFNQIADRNVRSFVAFRILFNARFYYPIFAVIFLDFGLSLEQFAILNSIWAATIILAEVPSGALSDLIGRKKLLVFAGALMVLEMCVWAFAPTGDVSLLFWLLTFNRVLSGLAEAAASGSDEALVFDSLDNADRSEEWSMTLQTVSRWQSIAFIFALVLGGLVYDPVTMGRITGMELTQETTMRWPLYLNLITAVMVFFVVVRMIEPEHKTRGKEQVTVRAAFAQTWRVGKWIAATPFALLVISAGAMLDGVIRMFVTMNSKYYQVIEFAPMAFGFIGAGVAVMNFFVAPLSRKMVDRLRPGQVFWIVTIMAGIGFVGAAQAIPYVGLVFSYLLFAAFSMTMFAISFYLNNEAEQSNRATLLSFKGLAFNLGYGVIGLLYAGLVQHLRKNPELAVDPNLLFKAGLGWFPYYFAAGMAVVVVFALLRPCSPRPAAPEKGQVNPA
ncbi:MAG: MFS transporter [Verrucomicrobiia bacterium]